VDDEIALVARSVREFVASVASIDEPVPAGGSVAALAGSASAALLALACGVQQRQGIDGAAALLARAQDLQAQLLALVDEDAAAFRAYLRAKRADERPDVEAALHWMSHVPLEIAVRSLDVVNLSREVGGRTKGLLLGDVRSARQLASAAVAAALAIAEQDVALHSDPTAKAQLTDELARLRDARLFSAGEVDEGPA
jgi:formiminotetrahydrofolate cyclodeaminase